MSHTSFRIFDRLTVDAALAAVHATLPQQSIYVLHQNCSEELKLIRLLIGSVKLEYLPTGAIWTQSKNYSIIGSPTVNFKRPAHIDVILQPYDIERDPLDQHLRATLAQGGYYGDLLSEILHYLYRTRAKEHTVAFLHLYRFLEHVAFAFPLLYAARTKNFVQAHAALKEFFEGSKKELRFFEKFVENAIDQPTRDQTVKLRFHTVDPTYVAKVFGIVRRQYHADDIVSEIPSSEIEIKCSTLSGLCINLRNRFFHFTATDPANISLKDVIDPDALFECVNPHIFNWLVVLYFETLKHRIHAPI